MSYKIIIEEIPCDVEPTWSQFVTTIEVGEFMSEPVLHTIFDINDDSQRLVHRTELHDHASVFIGHRVAIVHHTSRIDLGLRSDEPHCDMPMSVVVEVTLHDTSPAAILDGARAKVMFDAESPYGVGDEAMVSARWLSTGRVADTVEHANMRPLLAHCIAVASEHYGLLVNRVCNGGDIYEVKDELAIRSEFMPTVLEVPDIDYIV